MLTKGASDSGPSDLNVLAGYIWFYMSELKGQGIRFKLI